MDQMCQIIKCSQYVDELSWIKCVRLSSVHSMYVDELPRIECVRLSSVHSM